MTSAAHPNSPRLQPHAVRCCSPCRAIVHSFPGAKRDCVKLASWQWPPKAHYGVVSRQSLAKTSLPKDGLRQEPYDRLLWILVFTAKPVVQRRGTLPCRRERLLGGTQEWAGGVVLRPLGADLVGLRALVRTGEVGGAVRTRPRYSGGVEEDARMASAVGGVARHHGSYISLSWLQKEAVEADDNESSAGSSSASEMSGRHGPRYMASAPGAAGAARVAPGLVTTRPLEAALADSPSARLHHCAAHLPAHAHLRLLTCRLASLPTPWPSCRPPTSSPRWQGHHGKRRGGTGRKAPRLSRAGRCFLRERCLLRDTFPEATRAGHTFSFSFFLTVRP